MTPDRPRTLAPLVFVVGCALGLLLACGDGTPSESGGAPTDPDRGGAGPAIPLHEHIGAGDPRATEGGPDPEFLRQRVRATILLLGNGLGNHKPCGCTSPQVGGVERQARLLEWLRGRARDGVVGISLGWTLAANGEAQEEAKAAFLRSVYGDPAALGLDILLLGGTDLAVPAMGQPYGTGAGPHAPAPPLNVVPGSFAPFQETAPIVTVPWVGDWRVRAFTLVDPTSAREVDLATASSAIQAVLDPTAPFSMPTGPKPEPRMLTVVGVKPFADPEGTIQALTTALGSLTPAVVVDFSGVVGQERIPPTPITPGMAPLVVTIAEKGKAVGVLDLIEGKDGAFSLAYRQIRLVPHLDEGRSALRDEVKDLLSVYKTDVSEGRYLEDFRVAPPVPGPAFVGSAACARCHAAVYADWNDTAHAHAMPTLEAIHYHRDPECVRCHVVGWTREDAGRTWLRSRSGFISLEETPHLAGVGCENCHGAGGDHVRDPKAHPLHVAPGEGEAWQTAWRGRCIHCHDLDNSPRFLVALEAYLEAVRHRDVPKDKRTQVPAGWTPEGGAR